MIVEGEDATVVAQKCTRLTELHLQGAPAARACCLHSVPQRFCNVPTSGGRPVVKFLVDCAIAWLRLYVIYELQFHFISRA
jgi:hypothetical protein